MRSPRSGNSPPRILPKKYAAFARCYWHSEVPQDVSMTPQVFAILSALIEERLGLWYALADKPLVESKISARILELGYDSPLDYYYYLRYDDPDGSELD